MRTPPRRTPAIWLTGKPPRDHVRSPRRRRRCGTGGDPDVGARVSVPTQAAFCEPAQWWFRGRESGRRSSGRPALRLDPSNAMGTGPGTNHERMEFGCSLTVAGPTASAEPARVSDRPGAVRSRARHLRCCVLCNPLSLSRYPLYYRDGGVAYCHRLPYKRRHADYAVWLSCFVQE
jgi:hypothetical protein